MVSYIQAIEDGRWDLLPGQVYLKPFVKSLAEALGADYDELCELIDKTDKNQIAENAEPPGKGFDYRWLALAAMVVLAGLIIFLLRPEKTSIEESEGQETTAIVVPEQNNVIFERQYSSDLDLSEYRRGGGVGAGADTTRAPGGAPEPAAAQADGVASSHPPGLGALFAGCSRHRGRRWLHAR